MNFEVQNALVRLDAKTSDFFILEALAEPNPKLKETSAEILRTLGGDRSAAQQLLSMLRLY